jgi:hypothetical protein
MRNLTWTEYTDHRGNTMWSCEVGKHRLEVTDTGDGPKPFYGKITVEYGYGPILDSSGHYKTAQSARTGLTRRFENR